MKNNKLFVLTIIAIITTGCVGNDPNSMTKGVVAPEQATSMINLACGSDGTVTSLDLLEAGGAPFNSSFVIGEERGIRAYLSCSNGVKLPITTNADWSSSNQKIFTVTNSASETASKGYIVSKAKGDASLIVSYDVYEAIVPVHVVDAPLTGLVISSSRSDNSIAKGETLAISVYGTYSDGSSKALSGAKLTTTTPQIISINGDQISGIGEGDFILKAELNGYTAELHGKVLAAKIVGLQIIESNLSNFSIELPRTEPVNAKFELSDGNLIDIPKPQFGSLGKAVCSLYTLPSDSAIPFMLANNECSVISRTEAGVNKLTYRYVFVKDDGSIDTTKPALESSIVIENSNNNVKGLVINASQPMSPIVVGEPYRFRVYANLSNGSQIDVTKLVKVNVSCELKGADCSNKIMFGRTGYTGAGSGVDDGKGGVIQLISSLTADNSLPTSNMKLTITASLDQLSTSTSYDAAMIPNVISIKELSKYFSDNVFNLLTLDEKHALRTFNYVDNNSGKPIANNYFNAFIGLPSEALKASTLDDSVNTIYTAIPDGAEIPLSDDLSVPRLNEVSQLSSADIMNQTEMGDHIINEPLASVFCNNSDYNQTISTLSKSISYAHSEGFGRGFSVGAELGAEVDAKFGKVIIKSVNNYNQSWSWNDSQTQTIVLPSQNVLTPPRARGIVVQSLFSTKLGGTKLFNIPLDADSCIPFVATGTSLGTWGVGNPFTYSSKACIPFNKINYTEQMGSFDKLFTSNSSMTFRATYTQSSASTAVGSSAAIYVFKPGDAGYEAISCNTSQSASAKGSDIKLTSVKNGVQKVVTKGGQTIPLTTQNLVSFTSK